MDDARAARLAVLKADPGFNELGRHVEEARQRWADRLTREATEGMRGTTHDQADLDYYRGWYAGARWVLSLPEKADKKLTERTEEETSSE